MAKPKTFEEAQAAFETAKTELKEAKEALREFMVENKIKKDKTPEDPKLAGKFEKLQKAVEKRDTGQIRNALKTLHNRFDQAYATAAA